jgi:predicted nucleotidyltransferase
VHREINRAEAAGLVRSRKIGNTRLVRANTESPYYEGLSDILTKAFGPPRLLADALRQVAGIDRAFIFGSWAARYEGTTGVRPVGDIDLLILGEPDRDELYEALDQAGDRLGRPIEVVIRGSDWLETGTGSFHKTVVGRSLVELDVNGATGSDQRPDKNAATATMAS